MTIYNGNGFKITARELLFSVIIILVMTAMGFGISEKISSKADEIRQEYEQAAKIDGESTLFEYGMRTDIGNAFIYGKLAAVDTVSHSDIAGEYAYIKKVKEKYTRHTRTVHHRSGKTSWTTVEVYYTWDRVGSEEFHCRKITFLGHEFDYGTIHFPGASYIDTVKKSSELRYKYYGCATEYIGTLYANLGNNTVANTEFISGKSLAEAVEIKEDTASFVYVFWLIWIVLIILAVYGFCYWDNQWLED